MAPVYVIQPRRDLRPILVKRKDIMAFDKMPPRLKYYRSRLSQQFPVLYIRDITSALKFHKGHYDKTHRTLKAVVGGFQEENDDLLYHNDTDVKKCPQKLEYKEVHDGKTFQHVFHKMRTPRLPFSTNKIEEMRPSKVTTNRCEEDVKCHLGAETEQEDQAVFECACCFGEFPFENMAQCQEAHLVCKQCLTEFTREEIYGSAKLELPCMTEGCSSVYPKSEMKRCLTKSLVEKWDERIQEKNLALAKLDLTRCRHCNYACIVSPTMKRLACQRDTCLKVTCKDCGIDWHKHEGKSCDEMEHREDALRKSYEEKMTNVMVRTCSNCGAKFFKDEGCNMMTCSCGTSMCYVCRKTNIKYSHFCNHVRTPESKGCKSCSKCFIWSSTKDDEEKMINNLKKWVSSDREELGYLGNKVIGVPEENAATAGVM